MALGPGQVQKPGASFTHLTGTNQAPTMHQAELGAQDGVVAQSHTWPFPQGVWTLKQDGGLSKVLPWDECHTGEKVSWGPGLGPIGHGSQTTRPSLQLAPFLPLLFCVVYLFVCLLSEGCETRTLCSVTSQGSWSILLQSFWWTQCEISNGAPDLCC